MGTGGVPGGSGTASGAVALSVGGCEGVCGDTVGTSVGDNTPPRARPAFARAAPKDLDFVAASGLGVPTDGDCELA